jgi:general secretion pathway protein G
VQITPNNRTKDAGFTLVEILVVIVILGVIAAVVVFSVRGVTDTAEASACVSDAKILTVAAEAYLAQEQVEMLPAIGVSANSYELFLIGAGFIRQVSTAHDLHADGTVTTTGEPCP